MLFLISTFFMLKSDFEQFDRINRLKYRFRGNAINVIKRQFRDKETCMIFLMM